MTTSGCVQGTTAIWHMHDDLVLGKLWSWSSLRNLASRDKIPAL